MICDPAETVKCIFNNSAYVAFINSFQNVNQK